jgi:hypothetical protein
VVAIVAASVAVAMPMFAPAQVATTLNGAPVQVTPYVLEPGVPNIVISLGTPTPPPTSATQSTSTGSDALNTMLQQSWGAQAVAIAQSLGVNASALAATCAIESGCQNTGSSGVSSATGAFQMLPSTFSEMYAAAINDNASLAATTTGNINDPLSQAAAAAEYLKQGAQKIESAGVSNPTVADVRGYYNFGPSGGINVAMAPSSETMAAALPMYTAAQLAGNGIVPGETVAQWQASVASKIGTAANQSVIL